MKSKTQPGAQDASGGDTLYFNVSQRTATSINLGQGYDTVFVANNAGVKQIRLTFTSSEVGNSNANDSGTLANQDGGLAVRMQGEGNNDNLKGAVHRFDDEGIRFVSDGSATFDVRDLVSGTARGSLFSIVSLGTGRNDKLSEASSTVAAYINGGGGNDILSGGSADDFLVGGLGNDTLGGAAGNDSFIGGAGNDSIYGGAGDDTANLNVATDGSDAIILGVGSDTVNVSGASQVRLTFTSTEVGNDKANDGGNGTNQDGGLAVRIQGEAADGTTTGDVSRADDEGTTFIAADGTTFDVRDLVSGAERGDTFGIVRLGTSGDDTFDQTTSAVAQYMNGGAGADTITGGTANDFLVGGAGDDTLTGGDGNDSFIGGTGNDTIIGGLGDDTVFVNASIDGVDSVALGDGNDTVNVSTSPSDDPTQVRLTFSSADVGNGGILDSGDGRLAVHVQSEAADGSVTDDGGSRYDDEGITFVAAAGTTFDVRDVSGTARGDQFSVVVLGTANNDTLDQSAATGNVYLNGGSLSDTLTGGIGNDFLVGGGGRDYLDGGAGNDKLLGGDGLDVFRFSGTPGNDEILDFKSGKDVIDLSAFGISADNVSTTVVSGDTFVFVDGNSDGKIDFTIKVDGTTVAPGDFAF